MLMIVTVNKAIKLTPLVAAVCFSVPAGAWQMKQAPIMSDFAQQVDTNSPLPEYPRPQMVRSNWLSLNGIWQFQPGSTNDPVPTNQTLTNQILVPYPMESAISGVQQYSAWSWYRRMFTVPPAWGGQHILLHLDAVDWQSQLFINGQSVGSHKGGYDPFTYDITPYLTGIGPQELILQVFNPVDNGSQPRGKQTLYPGGIMYTSSSGIWQPVWLEPVPVTSLGALHLMPDIDNQLLKVTVAISGPTNGILVSVVARIGTNQVGSVSAAPGTVLSVPVPNPNLWSPTNPFLYDLTVTLSNGPAMLDSVNSYFGMRKISLGTNGNNVPMLLNNQFLFQFGPLDQGFWPDGIYTAPTDYALKTEIERTKALGFNMLRKHIKVERARWYYWADKLGVLVWQDMPSCNSYTGNPNPPAVDPLQFIAELTSMVTNHWNSPAVIMWDIFNEGQGQAGTANGVGQTNTAYLVQLVKSIDPSRMVNQASGNNWAGVGDIIDSHSYPAPGYPSSTTQVPVCGEYGGIALTIANHIWAPGFGYVYAVDGNDLTSQFENYATLASSFEQNNGLNAAVYTQITDCETELNGLFTYDRKVRKPDLLRMETAAALILALSQYATTVVVPSSQTNAQTWQYTTATPATNWYATNFDASAWSTGPGGFGTVGTPGAVVRTTWNTSDIWLRRTFNPGALTVQQITNLIFYVHHDEDVQIYINGVLAGSASGYVTSYGFLNMTTQGQAAILPNATNTLAVHCHQTVGGQYVDVGIDVRILLWSPPLPTLPSWTENGTGLQAQYSNGTNLSGMVLTRTDTQINFNWVGASPDPSLSNGVYSVRWTGQVQPRYSEVYTFHVTDDEGCRLWVNDQLIIDRWSAPPHVDYAGSIPLTGGQRYNLRAEYFNNGDPGSVVLEWNSVSQAREIVPQGVLFASTNGPGFLSPTNLPPTAIVSNRAPLLATPFVPLPLGSVRPKGWLLTQCQLQRDGLTGNAEAIYASDLGTNSGWLGGSGDNWERSPYYFKGLVSLAYVMNDVGLKQKAQKWMDWLLNNPGPNGYIGPVANNDWWPRMPATYALRDYYEATADSRVPTVLSNYFHYMLANLPARPLSDWSKARAGDEMDVALWLYNRNGDTNLITLVNLLHQQAYDWTGIYWSNNFMLYGTDFYPKHNVNIEQALKLPSVYYQVSQQPGDLNALALGLNNLLREHALSCGINSGTEFLAGDASIQGVELCAIVEAMLSLETAERITGDPALADRLETISFNALPAALANDIKGIQYYTLANNVIAINGGHGFNQDYANGTLPGPNSGFPCCRFNFHMGWPKYVQNSWAATSDGGLALLAYGPTVVNALVAGGQQVQISEDTGYPFEEQARLQVLASNAMSFPLSLRIPGWCTNATVTVNGLAQAAPSAGSYYRLNRTWTNGDLVVVNLPMPIQTRSGPSTAVAINRGPVVYSLRIGENWTVSTPDPLGLGFDEFNIHSTTPWAYALQMDPNNPAASLVVSNLAPPPDPFDPAQPSVSLLASARQVPNWTIGWVGTHAFEPPASPVASSSSLATVTLVPFGSQHMRLSWFPYLGTPAPTVGSLAETFDPTWSQRWTVFGGNWSARNGVLSTVPASANGAKALDMETAFTNFTYEGDVQVGPVGDAGLIFRVSKPDIGADAYCGYYAGISAASGQFIFGYASNGWHAVASGPMTITSNTFYHLKVQASGSSLKFFVTDTNTPVLTMQDSTFASGMLGVRDYCGDPNQSWSGFANLSAVESAGTVSNSPLPVLLHRWSFSGDGTDSIAGSNATLQGTATISSDSLVLNGSGHLTSYATVNVASDFANNASLTFETWMTVSNLASWAKVWMFGASTANYIDFTPCRGNNGNIPSISFNPGGTEVNTSGGAFEPPVLTAGKPYYAAAVYNSYSNTISLYLNGVLVATNNMGGGNLTQVMATHGYFGASLFNDPDLQGAINEVRIWSGALGTNAIMRNYLAGPDVVIVPPRIISQPQSQVVMAASNVTFTVAASGTAPLAYQWLFQGTNLPGATGTNLTLSGVLPVEAGPYSVSVTNLGGSITSAVAILAVTVPRPVVSRFSITGGPTFQLSGTGVVGQAYVLQSATNLTPTINWVSLATNTVGAGGMFQFFDPQVTNYPQRFYRVATP
jgi:hypothetical protein